MATDAKLSGALNGGAMGPYRATKLWNDVIRTFRTSVPLGRHRRYMKTYDNCFIANEAVDWLHSHLKQNQTFGPSVTRTQTIQLLEKFHKSRVFEDVRGSKNNRGEFSDNGRLYKFTHNSPIKTSRAPLGSKTNLQSLKDDSQPIKLDHEKLSPITCIPPSGLPECRLVARPLSQKEITDAWKDYTLNSLQKAVGVDTLAEILDASLVSGQHIMHNCLFINKNGVVTNIESKDQLPHWTLSAMRCLAHWPNKTDSIFPRYDGFEKDVFKVVVEYFQGLKEPLLTFDMYEVITNAFVLTESRFIKHSSPKASDCSFIHTPSSISSFASVENLIMNITMNVAGPSFRRTAARSEVNRPASLYDEQSSFNSLQISGDHPENSNMYSSRHYGSVSSLPMRRCETAFGPDNRTVTRHYFSSSSSNGDSGHVMSSCSQDFFSNGCIETDLDSLHSNDTNHPARSQSWSGQPPGVNPDNTAGPRKRPNSVSMHNNVSNCERLDKCFYENQKPYRSKTENAQDLKTTQQNIRSENNETMSTRTSVSSGIDNPSFRFDQQTENLAARKPPPYKPPPNYSRERHHSGSVGISLGPGYRRPVRLKRKSNSISNLNASPIVSALDAGTPSFLKKYGSLPDISCPSVKENLCSCLQLCLLLLPPGNRRKLHLLLRMLNKMLDNKELILDEQQPIRSLLLDKFSRSMLRSPEEADMDELLTLQIIEFLIDNYAEIMTVPADLKTSVETYLSQLKLSSSRVSIAQFEKQRITQSQEALANLLQDIVNDASMPQKEKRKRLKQFQKTYPSIYERRFPTKESEAEVFPQSSRDKPPLLSRPLHKLRNMRL